jgi:hypothetical protein
MLNDAKDVFQTAIAKCAENRKNPIWDFQQLPYFGSSKKFLDEWSENNTDIAANPDIEAEIRSYSNQEAKALLTEASNCWRALKGTADELKADPIMMGLVVSELQRARAIFWSIDAHAFSRVTESALRAMFIMQKKPFVSVKGDTVNHSANAIIAEMMLEHAFFLELNQVRNIQVTEKELSFVQHLITELRFETIEPNAFATMANVLIESFISGRQSR